MFGFGQKRESAASTGGRLLRRIALTLLAGTAVASAAAQPGAQRAEAFLGPLTTRAIATDSVPVSTPATWNAHLSKLVTDGTWNYAVFTSYTQDPSGRVSWIYKRRQGASTWHYTGRELRGVHQPPGLALDRAGHLHVAFDCLAGYQCTSGVDAGGTTPFYDLIFYAHNPDGSLQLGTEPNQFWQYSEQAAGSYGYMGISTDPSPRGSQTFVSVLNNQWDQLLLRVGAPDAQVVPHVSAPSYVLYPQMPISATSGKRYYLGQELIPQGNPNQYKAIAVYTAPDFRLRFADYVSDPDARNRFVRISDSSFGPNGRLYFLYIKMPAVNGACSYLVREKSPGSGRFSAPLPAGCHSIYAQLQVSSRGVINILDSSGLNLVLSQSKNGGHSWHQSSLPLPVGEGGLPPGSNKVANPTLVKPWTSPRGYNHDVLHGMLANWSGPDPNFGDGVSWSSTEFSIPIKGRTKRCGRGRASRAKSRQQTCFRKHKKGSSAHD